MFWMTKKVREELQELLQDDYQKVQRILTLRPLARLMARFGSLGSLLIMSIAPQIPHQYHKIGAIVLMMFSVVLLFSLVIRFLYSLKKLEYTILARIKKSLYQKRVTYTLVIADAIYLLSLCMIIYKLFQ